MDIDSITKQIQESCVDINIAVESLRKQSKQQQDLVRNGDIIVGMDGEFHINTWSGDTAFLVQRTCRIDPHDPKVKGWLLYAICEPIKLFEKTVVGATVAHLGKNTQIL